MDGVRAALRERLAGLLAVLEAGLVERRQVLLRCAERARAQGQFLTVAP